jgi:preprotein translocase subunit SecE
MVEKIKTFLKESKAELAKVVWPDRKTTAASTVVVVGLSLIVGLYLGLLDVILSKVFEIIFS